MYSIYYKMSKQPVKRKTKKEKVVKKTKAKQIIKQKVVINLDKAIGAARRRGRPRKTAEKQGPVPKGDTVLTLGKDGERQYYDAERAAKKYADEMKKDIKRLEGGQSDAVKALEGIYKAGQALQKQIMDRPTYPESKQLLESHLATPGKGRGGFRAGSGRKPGSKNKPKESESLGPTIAEKLRSETAKISREIETQTEPTQSMLPPAAPAESAPQPAIPPPAPSKKKGGSKEKK